MVRSAGIPVVRCRLSGRQVRVEVRGADRRLVTRELLDGVAEAMCCVEPEIETVTLDDLPYRPGRAVLQVL